MNHNSLWIEWLVDICCCTSWFLSGFHWIEDRSSTFNIRLLGFIMFCSKKLCFYSLFQHSNPLALALNKPIFLGPQPWNLVCDSKNRWYQKLQGKVSEAMSTNSTKNGPCGGILNWFVFQLSSIFFLSFHIPSLQGIIDWKSCGKSMCPASIVHHHLVVPGLGLKYSVAFET